MKDDPPPCGQAHVSLSDIQSLLDRQVEQIDQLLTKNAQQMAREMESATYLQHAIRPSAKIPGAGGWAASYQTVAHVVSAVLSARSPVHVLEVGSGVSTMWVAQACRIRGDSHITSLEHDPRYAHQTRLALERQGAHTFTTLFTTPLAQVSVEGSEYRWYETTYLNIRDRSVDVLFVDGPPGTLGPYARYPAFPLLHNLLKSGAIVILDDTHRENEQRVMREWQRFAEGRGMQLTFLESVGRSSVMSFQGSSER